MRVDPDGRLTIPDYAGNRYYNPLGNILVTSRAALIVPDFEHGDLLLVTGRASLGLDAQGLDEAHRVEAANCFGIWIQPRAAG